MASPRRRRRRRAGPPDLGPAWREPDPDLPPDVKAALAARVLEALGPYVSEARRARIHAVLDARTRSVAIVLEDVLNEHNGAAVLRTADALGLMEVHVIPTEGRFKVSKRIALGSQKWLDVSRYGSVQACYAALRRRGFAIWASSVHGDARPVHDLPQDQPIALVFGNEQAGLSEAAAEAADGRFHVPTYGFVESLNISVAAALALAAVVEPRRRRGRLEPLEAADRAVVEARWLVESVRAARQLLTRAGIHTLPEAPPAYELTEGKREP